jgi:hypothetical protein
MGAMPQHIETCEPYNMSRALRRSQCEANRASNHSRESQGPGENSTMHGCEIGARINHNSAGHPASEPKRTSFKLPIVLLFLLGMSGACGISGHRAASEAATNQFHRQLDAEQYSVIYSEADDQFRESTSESKLTELLTAIRGKLGAVQSTEITSWFFNFGGQGPFATVVSHTRFTKGDAEERFVWRIRDGRARLMNYKVNSNALLLK